MNAWLAPVRRALDGLARPVPVFFRDDDAGWEDARLFQLLEVFRAHRMPIDLAVIPDALTPALAAELLERRRVSGGRIGLHQHGRSHRNHEPAGRQCEFGASRTPAEVRADLRAGQLRLAELLGPAVDPIFTPPWNRCSTETGRALRELEVVALSRDRTAPPLGLPGLGELPIAVDWFAKRRGIRLDRLAFGATLAEALTEQGPVGIMLHHAVMEPEDFQCIEQLLALLAGHGRVLAFPMMALVAERVVVP